MAAFGGALVLDQTGAVGRAPAQDRNVPDLPKEVIGIRIPDSDLARGAAIVAQAESPPALFNHCMRTFILASVEAKRLGWKYDEELVFISSALHDLGLIPRFADPYKTFEHTGADYAETFVLKGGFTPDKAQRVWKSILWHAGQVPPDVTDPDIHMVRDGAAMDVFGPSQEQISDDQFQAIQAAGALPRLQFKRVFLQILTDHVARSKQPSWTKAFVDRPWPNFLNNRWPE